MELYNRIKKVDVNTVSEMTMEDAAPMLKKQQQLQMLQGLNQKGEKIGKYRNPKYAAKKNSLNPLPGFGFVDLKLTGAFQDAIVIDVRGERIVFEGADIKTEDLAKKYGETILGLNEESRGEVVKEIRPVFVKNMRKEAGL